MPIMQYIVDFVFSYFNKKMLTKSKLYDRIFLIEVQKQSVAYSGFGLPHKICKRCFCRNPFSVRSEKGLGMRIISA